MRVAPTVVLTEDQERTLQQWARGRSLPARQVERARVVLLAAAGKQDLEIAAFSDTSVNVPSPLLWNSMFFPPRNPGGPQATSSPLYRHGPDSGSGAVFGSNSR